jgi:hypothetical protein
MYKKSDDKLFDNRVFQEMLDTERSYNGALNLLGLALLMDTLVQEDPVLLELKKIIPILTDISNGLLKNAESTVSPELSEPERNMLKVQRTQLLTAFFKVYKDYATIFDNYLAANNAYALKYASNPEQNPFHKIDTYLVRFGNKLGLGAHLIQPIQRGPRYSLLVKEAAKTVAPEDESFNELDALQRLISAQLFEINSSMSPTAQTEGYWFGKITYTLLFGEPGKTPVKPEPIPAKIEENEAEAEAEAAAEPYRFGDYTRNFLWGKPKANASQSRAASSVPVEKPSEDIIDEFTIIDGENEANTKPEDDDPSKGFGHQG